MGLPKRHSKSLSECPFCGVMLLAEEKARGYGKMEVFLGYLVKVYGGGAVPEPGAAEEPDRGLVQR